jgi:RNA polymerase sigma-B factor
MHLSTAVALATDSSTSSPGDEHATELINAMARLPRTDPERASLREAAIIAWTPMPQRLARRYASRGECLDDLTQTAVLGLIKAVDGFDPGRGADFPSYAIPTVLGELKKHFRDRAWDIRVPRRLQEMTLAISKARGVLVQTLGREPTVAEIAGHIGVHEETVIEGLESAHAYRATSLSKPIGSEGHAELGDSLGEDDHGYDLAELHLALEPAMACLTPREQRIIALRFYGNESQSRIAEQVGVSQMHVSRLLSQTLAKLRTHLGLDACSRPR